MNKKVLLGQTKDHLYYDESINRYFHKDIYEDFLYLKDKAKESGVDLYVTSSFRSFEDQLRIWNEKAQGKRPLYDDDGNELIYSELREREVLDSILRWSAIPGTSRHHWGTDLDLVDKNTWPEGYHIKLNPNEFEKNGPFYQFKLWFDDVLKKDNGHGFFRPYERDQGGVAPEMWHLSHKKVSYELFKSYTLLVFREHIEENIDRIALSDLILENSDFYYENYITNICSYPSI